MTIQAIHELVEFAGEEYGYQVYKVQPDVMYPAMVNYARSVLRGEIIVYGGEQEFRLQLERLPPEAWAWALLPIDEVTSAQIRAIREQALELLRRWFTRRLKEYVKQPIGIRIKRDDRYRLNW